MNGNQCPGSSATSNLYCFLAIDSNYWPSVLIEVLDQLHLYQAIISTLSRHAAFQVGILFLCVKEKWSYWLISDDCPIFSKVFQIQLVGPLLFCFFCWLSRIWPTVWPPAHTQRARLADSIISNSSSDVVARLFHYRHLQHLLNHLCFCVPRSATYLLLIRGCVRLRGSGIRTKNFSSSCSRAISIYFRPCLGLGAFWDPNRS